MSLKIKQIDLSIVKRLVSELEASLNRSEEMQANQDNSGPNLELIVEMNKATGLATGFMAEGSMLMGDIQSVLKDSQIPPKNDFIEKLMGGLKPTIKN